MPQKARKSSIVSINNLLGSSGQVKTSAEQLHFMHEKLAKLQSTIKASKAERAGQEKRKSKKAKLHESGQFSPTTSKLIRHFLSK